MTQLRPGPDDVSYLIDDLRAADADHEFLAHAEQHLPRLHDLFTRLYGERPDGLERWHPSSIWPAPRGRRAREP